MKCSHCVSFHAVSADAHLKKRWHEQSADFLFTCCCFRRRSCLLTLTPPSLSLFFPLLSHHTLPSIPFHHHRGKSDGALRPPAVKGTRGAKVEGFLADRWERRGLRSGFGASREWRKGRDGRKGEDRHAAAAQSRQPSLPGIKLGLTAALPALLYYKNVPSPAFSMQIASQIMPFCIHFADCQAVTQGE